MNDSSWQVDVEDAKMKEDKRSFYTAARTEGDRFPTENRAGSRDVC
ncbi:hypothetical protein [Rhodopirellula bahusiensis]